MSRIAIALAAMIACSNGTEPKAVHCAQEKRAEYAADIGGTMPEAWGESDVWRLSPITTIYFNADCSVTRIN